MYSKSKSLFQLHFISMKVNSTPMRKGAIPSLCILEDILVNVFLSKRGLLKKAFSILEDFASCVPGFLLWKYCWAYSINEMLTTFLFL